MATPNRRVECIRQLYLPEIGFKNRYTHDCVAPGLSRLRFCGGKKMRAYEIVADTGVDALALNQRPSPQPAAGEILVRIRASSINYRDLSTIEDPRPRGIAYPRIPNSDGAGEVLAVGAGVTRFAPGDRVAGCFFQDWNDGAISTTAMASALVSPGDSIPNRSTIVCARFAVLSIRKSATGSPGPASFGRMPE